MLEIQDDLGNAIKHLEHFLNLEVSDVVEVESKSRKSTQVVELNLNDGNERVNTPIVLNPQKASFQDVANWARLRGRLSESTIEKRLRYARFMETHKVGIDFRNPTYENFIRHMDYREEIEGATASALKHEVKTMRTFLESYGMAM